LQEVNASAVGCGKHHVLLAHHSYRRTHGILHKDVTGSHGVGYDEACGAEAENGVAWDTHDVGGVEKDTDDEGDGLNHGKMEPKVG